METLSKSFQIGRKPKSKTLYNFQHQVKTPLYLIKSQPKFSRGAKRKILDEEGNVEFDGNKTTITHFYVLDKGLDLAIQNVKNDGFKKVKVTQMTDLLPIHCPKCGKKEGHPVCNYDDRGYDYSKREVPVPPIRLWWNHSKPKSRHLITTYVVKKKGPIVRKLSKGVTFESINPHSSIRR